MFVAPLKARLRNALRSPKDFLVALTWTVLIAAAGMHLFSSMRAMAFTTSDLSSGEYAMFHNNAIDMAEEAGVSSDNLPNKLTEGDAYMDLEMRVRSRFEDIRNDIYLHSGRLKDALEVGFVFLLAFGIYSFLARGSLPNQGPRTSLILLSLIAAGVIYAFLDAGAFGNQDVKMLLVFSAILALIHDQFTAPDGQAKETMKGAVVLALIALVALHALFSGVPDVTTDSSHYVDYFAKARMVDFTYVLTGLGITFFQFGPFLVLLYWMFANDPQTEVVNQAELEIQPVFATNDPTSTPVM